MGAYEGMARKKDGVLGPFGRVPLVFILVCRADVSCRCFLASRSWVCCGVSGFRWSAIIDALKLFSFIIFLLLFWIFFGIKTFVLNFLLQSLFLLSEDCRLLRWPPGLELSLQNWRVWRWSDCSVALSLSRPFRCFSEDSGILGVWVP